MIHLKHVFDIKLPLFPQHTPCCYTFYKSPYKQYCLPLNRYDFFHDISCRLSLEIVQNKQFIYIEHIFCTTRLTQMFFLKEEVIMFLMNYYIFQNFVFPECQYKCVLNASFRRSEFSFSFYVSLIFDEYFVVLWNNIVQTAHMYAVYQIINVVGDLFASISSLSLSYDALFIILLSNWSTYLFLFITTIPDHLICLLV